MFELMNGTHRRAPHRGVVPLLVSSAAHLLALGAIVAVPLFYIGADLPEVPSMMAFVTASPAPPPPPPPPPPAQAASRPRPVRQVVPTNSSRIAVPVEAPKEVVPERNDIEWGSEGGMPGGVAGGVPGGIPGGVPGGVPGGMVGGLLPPPPPPPAPPIEREPVRVGGGLTTPSLVSRVEPEYPPLAMRAHVQGVVILEAVVGRDGHVEHVTVLRSIPLLDAAAVRAVRQWRYSPLLLNGRPERFVLTLTVSFNLDT